MNLANLQLRSAVVKAIRRWFDERDFLEVHTARLVGVPGQEPYLEPFWTEVTSPSIPVRANGVRPSVPAALITSPEYMCKRLIAAGIPRLYDLGPCFRNGEPWDGTHDPEFLLLEWYRRDAGLEDLMRDTEQMMRWVSCIVGAQFIAPGPACMPAVSAMPADPGVINHAPTFDRPFRRLTVEQAWKQYANIDLAPLLGDRAAMADTARAFDQTVSESDTWDDLYFKIFLSHIEPKLGWEGENLCPTFLYRYPASQAALARPSADDPRWADRVELYVGNLELANGFAELSDEVEQRARFLEEQELRKSLGKPTWPLDERFLTSLPQMGDAAGIAFGVDRLVMLLSGVSSINDVIPASARERFDS